MSLDYTYTCDICKTRLTGDEVRNCFGVHFAPGEFTLGNYGCTEGTHICYDCARILRRRLNHEEIVRTLRVNREG